MQANMLEAATTGELASGMNKAIVDNKVLEKQKMNRRLDLLSSPKRITIRSTWMWYHKLIIS